MHEVPKCALSAFHLMICCLSKPTVFTMQKPAIIKYTFRLMNYLFHFAQFFFSQVWQSVTDLCGHQKRFECFLGDNHAQTSQGGHLAHPHGCGCVGCRGQINLSTKSRVGQKPKEGRTKWTESRITLVKVELIGPKVGQNKTKIRQIWDSCGFFLQKMVRQITQ